MADTILRRMSTWAAALTLDQVPPGIREHAINQVLSTFGALYAGWDSDLGPSLDRAYPLLPGTARVVPTGASAPASHAAMKMAAWSMILDYDDVMLGGHTGHCSVLAPFSIASAGGFSGADVLLAQIVANEIAARINMVCAGGATRGQMATHLHLLGAAAARAKMERLDQDLFAEALGLALSYPSKALYPSFLGSDAKALCAALGVREGMESVDLARQGLRAAASILEGKHGFFAANSRAPAYDFLDGLGQRWHTGTNSYKIYPVCGYLCSAVDAVLQLLQDAPVQVGDIAEVTVWGSVFTVGMDAHSAPYLNGPESRISTLTFSTPFVIASTLLAGEFTPEQLRRCWIADPRVWALAARIRSRHDPVMTRRALTADIPVGAALRRMAKWKAAAFGWNIAGAAFGKHTRWRSGSTYRTLAALAWRAGEQGPFDFSCSTKPLSARVDIRMNNGTRRVAEREIPIGFAGAALAPGELSVRERMRMKFIAAARNAIGNEEAVSLASMTESLEALTAPEMNRWFETALVPSKRLASNA